MNEYYTYAYLREDKSPYYIGMGKGIRIHKQHKRGVQDMRPPLHRRIFLKVNLTREDAIKHEIYMISILGRKDTNTGILRNLTDGGEGATGGFGSKYRSRGTLGKKMSPLTCQRMSRSKNRWWLFKHRDGRVIHTFTNLKQFCVDNNLDRSTMNKVLRNKPGYYQHKGWTLELAQAPLTTD